jgi:hypothetical protein
MGRSIQEADVLTQYLWTAIGKMAADDFRPELLTEHDDQEGDLYAKQANKEYDFAWGEEIKGDRRCLEILHGISIYPVVPVRCRYDRGRGPFLGDVPHVGAEPYTHQPPGAEPTEQNPNPEPPPPTTYAPGKPILDPAAARAYVADKTQYGEPVDLRPLREGAINWEVGSFWNTLPPPGVLVAEDFPYDLLVRAVHVDTLKGAYPQMAGQITAMALDQMGVLGQGDQTNSGQRGSAAKLTEHALVYTGYLRPTVDHPRGQTIVWTGQTVLQLDESLPYTKAPWGPRAGITYFRYWPVKGRFLGRPLIEPMIGPQRVRNKRLSQADETIDRGQPFGVVTEGDIPDKDGSPLEWVELKMGASSPVLNQGIGPGPWMRDSILQCDEDLQKVSGLNDVSVGASAPAGTPYASLAQQNENDQTKLGPIVQEFKLGVAELTRDSVEAMDQWPDGKSLLIAGEDDRLEIIVHKKPSAPAGYMVRPAKGGGLPRSQGAELQKINDLWTAAETSGAVAQDAVAWLDWFKNSLDAGQAQDFPEMNAKSQQQHKAALENVIMTRILQVVPVAPYDDAQIHIPVHDQQQATLAQAAMLGDRGAAAASQVIEQHKQMHLQMAQENQPPGTGLVPTAPPGLPPGAAPPQGPGGPPSSPPGPPAGPSAPFPPQ